MRMFLYIFLIVLGLILVAIGVLGILGSRLPEEHKASGSVTLSASQADVYALINDIEKFPQWCKDFTKMERLPDQGGKAVWRQHMGRNSFVSVNETQEPPRRVVRSVQDDAKMFSGTWDHVIEPTGVSSCMLTIKETGKVPGAIPRAIMHYIIGEDFTIKKFLKAVKAKVG
jgi:hypothetical protein